ncbi:MAG TPA: type III polyketide synthase [Candidatus Thermoplasmatota archaeon]|nr:type III polyketide synthase [Candidatus Thermoplasmatota archaeon]
MPVLGPVATAVPADRIPQDKLRELARSVLADTDPRLARILSVFDNAGIDERAFAMPLEWYYGEHGFKDRGEAFLRVGMDLVERATRDALDAARIGPREVDGVLFVSTTGIATPSLDARLANVVGMRPDVVRLPIWGLGCSGGVAGLNRAADLARARPDGRFLLVALELCSLAFDMSRLDKKMLVAASLFGDGCAATIVSGDALGAPGARHLRGASHLFPRTERVMGWDVEDRTLDVVFSTEIPEIVARETAGVVRPFLDGAQPDHWILHPGGTKVLEAYETSLALPADALRFSRAALRAHGNMSSPTVLFALAGAQSASVPRAGETALIASVGPGFAMDLALVTG